MKALIYNKHSPCIYKDRHGQHWITAEGVYKYFRLRKIELKKYFYCYEDFLKSESSKHLGCNLK